MQVTFSTQITAQLDDTTMSQFGKACEVAGLSPSNALGVLIRGVINHTYMLSGETDAEPEKPATEKKPSKLPYGFGCMKGKMWIADDFDAPMEDFKDYM